MTGETVPYVVRQRKGPSLRSRFLSLFDVGRRSKPFVWEVQRLSSPDGTATGFHVTTEQGSDVGILSAEGQTISVDTPEGTLETNGTITAFSLSPDGSPAFGYLYGGSQAKFLETTLELDYPVLEGRILDVHTTNEESYYQLDLLDLGPDPKGLTLLVQAADYSTGYPILHVEASDMTPGKPSRGRLSEVFQPNGLRQLTSVSAPPNSLYRARKCHLTIPLNYGFSKVIDKSHHFC